MFASGVESWLKPLGALRRGPLRQRLRHLRRILKGERRALLRVGEAAAGWRKFEQNPVLGGALGTCFDAFVVKEEGVFRMWFSWRPKRSIALTESSDGVRWSEPVIVLAPNPTSGWEGEVNRPCVLQRNGVYHLWYTGQEGTLSRIGHATSSDGRAFRRVRDEPELGCDAPWEKAAVMCPHVLYDAERLRYCMWYSGGDQYEPDAIGYATSPDGTSWTKHPGNPVFRPSAEAGWERHKVTACHVAFHEGTYLMFYIGFANEHAAQIGLARSADGVSGWIRHPDNPVIRPGTRSSAWDFDAVYKPTVVHDDDRWLLWFNGRNESTEQIGLAVHEGSDLWQRAQNP
jgi:predicted GH43/DUF377 family glycosyl hydrolase